MINHDSPTRKQNHLSSPQTHAQPETKGLEIPSSKPNSTTPPKRNHRARRTIKDTNQPLSSLENQPDNRSHQIDQPGRKPANGFIWNLPEQHQSVTQHHPLRDTIKSLLGIDPKNPESRPPKHDLLERPKFALQPSQKTGSSYFVGGRLSSRTS